MLPFPISLTVFWILLLTWTSVCVPAQLLSSVLLFATPWIVVCQAPLSMELSRQEYWHGLPFPPPGDFPNPGIEPASPGFPALASWFFITEPPGKPCLFPFSSVQSLSRVRLFVTPWIAARQASLSITNSQSSLRFTSIESVMTSSHLILCRSLLLLLPSYLKSYVI